MKKARRSERHADPQTGLVTSWYIFVVQWPLTLMASVIAGLVTGLLAGKAERTQAVQGLAMILIAIGLFSMAMTFVAENESDKKSATLGEAAGLEIVEGENLVREISWTSLQAEQAHASVKVFLKEHRQVVRGVKNHER